MSVSSDVAQIERSLADLLRIASSPRVHETRLQATGLSISRTEYRFLSRLVDSGPRSVSDLAAVLDVSQPTASRALRQLEAAGFVARRADVSDGRVARFGATARGRRVRQRLQQHMHEQLLQALSDLPARRCHELAVALDELVQRLHGRSVPA